MRLSILDQVPLTEHAPTRAAALASGLTLAQDADALGYQRIWFAEHHNSQSFASAAPEMMTALALERTTRIRVGTGAILLPYYSAQKVTETMGLLSAVHPDRVDTGVGRAALSDPNYAAKIAALVHELDAGHAASTSEPAGRVWVLGPAVLRRRCRERSVPNTCTDISCVPPAGRLRPALTARQQDAPDTHHTPSWPSVSSQPKPRNRPSRSPKPCCSGGFARILGTMAPSPRLTPRLATSGACQNAPGPRNAAKH